MYHHLFGIPLTIKSIDDNETDFYIYHNLESAFKKARYKVNENEAFESGFILREVE